MDFDIVEEWKQVVGFEGKYEVSNLGRIKSLNYRSVKGVEQVLKPYLDRKNHNYHKYTLVNSEGKVITLLVHPLVIQAFIGKSQGKFVDHIDGDGSNNALSNLRYCTHRENLTFDNVNFKKPKSSKYAGVSYNRNSNGKKKWRAIIKHKKITYSVGTFSTEIEARNAYLSKLNQLQPC